MSIHQDGYAVVTVYTPNHRPDGPIINVYHYPTEGKARYKQRKLREEYEEMVSLGRLITRVRPMYKEEA